MRQGSGSVHIGKQIEVLGGESVWRVPGSFALAFLQNTLPYYLFHLAVPDLYLPKTKS